MGLLSKNLLESIHISLITGMTEQRIRDAIKDF